tara:strand:- start:70 stop:687 length:618 start_codon:yes stop_codon:yes gene_type:complete
MKLQNKEDQPQVILMFPVPVWVTSFKDDYSSEFEWMKKLDWGMTDQTSVNNYVLDDPILADLRSFIELSITKYTSEIFRYEQEFFITQSWVNKKSKGVAHHEHRHPNSIVSGVWYPHISKDTSPILFSNLHEKNIVVEPVEYNDFNADSYKLLVNSGSLILFPSYVKHSVPPNQCDEDRMSLSFNTWTKGSLGDKNSLNYIAETR